MEVQLDPVGVVTRGMRASLAFYRRLGLETPAGAEDEPHAGAITPGGLRVAWDTVDLIKRTYPDHTAPSGGHRMALAFLCPTPADVDAKYTELSALGHRDPWDAFWGRRYAVVRDPDGNHVDLFSPL